MKCLTLTVIKPKLSRKIPYPLLISEKKALDCIFIQQYSLYLQPVLHKYTNMSTKKERLDAICGIIQTKVISNQEELLKELEDSGFSVTQATLSRDIKQLKVAKVHDGNGDYVYRLPEESISKQAQPEGKKKPNIEFSGNLAVVKTRPGYAMGIASDIDSHAPSEILATIAGDDTILVIPRNGVSQEKVIAALSHFI